MPPRVRMPSERRGNFGFRSIVSNYEFRAEDAYVDRDYLGLAPFASYVFCCLEDDDGNLFAPIRKFTTELSGGLQLSSNTGQDNLEIDPAVFGRSHRGAGVRWSRTASGGFTIAAATTPSSQPVLVEIEDDRFSWSEGDLMSLQGRCLGRGYQWYTPNQDERGGHFYATVQFEATGTVLGRPVHGFFSLDQFYGPTGVVYNTGPIFNAMELAWVAFVNIYADGSHESGGLCLGRTHWGWGIVSDRDGTVSEALEIEADVALDDDGYISTANFHMPDGDYLFAATPRSQMRALAAARGDAYHGQAGRVRRAGDDRIPTVSLAWIESFPLNGLDRHAPVPSA